jgi:hypothetical protein
MSEPTDPRRRRAAEWATARAGSKSRSVALSPPVVVLVELAIDVHFEKKHLLRHLAPVATRKVKPQKLCSIDRSARASDFLAA